MDQKTFQRDDTPQLSTLMDQLTNFDGPPEQFLEELLRVQCKAASADAGAMLGVDGQGRPAVLVAYPGLKKDEEPPAWLRHAAGAATKVFAEGKTEIVPLRKTEDYYDESPYQHVVVIPIQHGGAPGRVRGAAAYMICTYEPELINQARERLELTMGLLLLHEMRMTLQVRRADTQRMRMAMEILAALNEHSRLKAAGIALCNTLAAKYSAERVSIGFLKGRYVKAVSLSHTEKFNRKMRLVQDIESTMEECLDQDVEIIFPTSPEATYVCRAAETLSQRHGPTSQVTLPLRHDDKPVGAICIERAPDRPFQFEEVEALRLTCDLCVARLYDLYQHDKWIGAKAADSTRKGLSFLVGAKHTWAKLVALLVIAAVLFLVFVDGEDRIDASFEIQAVQRRAVSVPFESRLTDVRVEPDDKVVKGKTILAVLDTAELQLQLAASRAERARYVKEADLALRDAKTVEVQIANAKLARVDAEIKLLEYRIAQGTIFAPIDGTVVAGDRKREIGKKVEIGEMLFEIAPLETLRAELSVPEHRITELIDESREAIKDNKGQLASVSHPGDYLGFEIERINPVAEVVEQSNVFKVRVKLLETRDWLRPGMKGVGKIDVGKRSYGYIWTRDMINWIRMKLWI